MFTLLQELWGISATKSRNDASIIQLADNLWSCWNAQAASDRLQWLREFLRVAQSLTPEECSLPRDLRWEILGHMVARSQTPLVQAPLVQEPCNPKEAMIALAIAECLPPHWAERNPWLQACLLSSADADLPALLGVLQISPPKTRQEVSLLFQPLLEGPPERAVALFPQALDALAVPELAPSIVELANQLARQGVVPHPLAGREAQLVRVLKMLVEHLQSIVAARQANAGSSPGSPTAFNHHVALVIALCDSFAMLSAAEAVPILKETLALPHRRIRTEAASALARLQDEQGIRALVDLAADVGSRARALAYLKEVGAQNALPSWLQTPEAVAQGAFAELLTNMNRLELPPRRVETLFQCRTDQIAGHSELAQYFVFRFEATLFDGQEHHAETGVAVCGPETRFEQEAGPAWTGEDYFAEYAYSMWRASAQENPGECEIISANKLSPADIAKASVQAKKWLAQGYDQIGLEFQAKLKKQSWLGLRATYAGQPGALIVGPQESLWVKQEDANYPVRPVSEFFRMQGRRLLSEWKSAGTLHIGPLQ